MLMALGASFVSVWVYEGQTQGLVGYMGACWVAMFALFFLLMKK